MPAVLINFRASSETKPPSSRIPRKRVRKPKPRAISCDFVRSSNQRAALGYAAAATANPITREAREINSRKNPLMMAAATDAITMTKKVQSSQFHAAMIFSASRAPSCFNQNSVQSEDCTLAGTSHWFSPPPQAEAEVGEVV